MISGRVISARAQATRCCCPPESCAGRWPSRSSRPTAATTWSAQAFSGVRPDSDSGRTMFSHAVSVGSRLKDWNTNPICSRRTRVRSSSSSEPRSVPAILAVPEVGSSSPARQCRNVDLPEPDGPMIAVNSPRPKRADTPSSATTAASPSP